jgi:predicted transcriptional regulator
MITRRDDVEEIIIQALGHSERRNIIEIIGTSEEGVGYSEILGEIGLNTGKMNYHLKLLEGVIERDQNRRYKLTPIGKKAFMVLNSLSEDLENGYEDYLVKARQSQGTGVKKIANIWFILITVLSISALAGAWMFVNTGVSVGKLSSVYFYYVWGLVALTAVGLFLLRGWVTREAENIQVWVNRILGKLNKR